MDEPCATSRVMGVVGLASIDECLFAGLFLDQAFDVGLCRKRAVHAGFTGSCVLGTGLGKISVPVVGDRSLKRVDSLGMTAVAASVLNLLLILDLLDVTVRAGCCIHIIVNGIPVDPVWNKVWVTIFMTGSRLAYIRRLMYD